MKPLLVGQAPARSMAKGTPAFHGSSSGKRLANLLQISEDDLWRLVDTVNLVDEYPGPNGKWDKFPMEEAKQGASHIKREKLNGTYEMVILAGLQTARAWGFNKPDLFVINTSSVLYRDVFWTYRVVVIPHPGGTNVWYNNPDNRETCRLFLTDLLLRNNEDPVHQ